MIATAIIISEPGPHLADQRHPTQITNYSCRENTETLLSNQKALLVPTP